MYSREQDWGVGGAARHRVREGHDILLPGLIGLGRHVVSFCIIQLPHLLDLCLVTAMDDTCQVKEVVKICDRCS